MAPTTHLNEILRPENERKGFCLIKLSRCQKIVTSAQVISYQYHDKAPEKSDKKCLITNIENVSYE